MDYKKRKENTKSSPQKKRSGQIQEFKNKLEKIENIGEKNVKFDEEIE